MTIEQETSQNHILEALQTSTDLPSEGLDNITKLLARRAAERDYARHLQLEAEKRGSERRTIE